MTFSHQFNQYEVSGIQVNSSIIPIHKKKKKENLQK